MLGWLNSPDDGALRTGSKDLQKNKRKKTGCNQSHKKKKKKKKKIFFSQNLEAKAEACWGGRAHGQLGGAWAGHVSGYVLAG